LAVGTGSDESPRHTASPKDSDEKAALNLEKVASGLEKHFLPRRLAGLDKSNYLTRLEKDSNNLPSKRHRHNHHWQPPLYRMKNGQRAFLEQLGLERQSTHSGSLVTIKSVVYGN